jgi:hypothetical protein
MVDQQEGGVAVVQRYFSDRGHLAIRLARICRCSLQIVATQYDRMLQDAQDGWSERIANCLKLLVPRGGIEPSTRGFSVRQGRRETPGFLRLSTFHVADRAVLCRD